MNYNKVILVGRITQDPQLRTGMNGNVVTFNLAVNRNYSKEDKQADFFRIVCFGKNAEFVASYLRKGRLILIDGSLRNNSWTDRDGKQRVTTEVIANKVQPLDKKENVEEISDSSGEEIPPSFDNDIPSEDEDNDVPF